MNLPNRKKLRLNGYDYSTPGYYFVTICSNNKKNIFCHINSDGTIKKSWAGDILESNIKNIESHYSNVRIDKYVIMPNHLHMIVVISYFENTERSRPFPTLSNVIGLFKSGVSNEVGFTVWQKSFHDHIIRNEKSYLQILKYIENNPLSWMEDCYYIAD